MKLVPIILFFLLILLIAAVGFSGYLFFQNQKLVKILTTQSSSPTPVASTAASAAVSTAPSASPSPAKHTLKEVQSTIESAVNSKNTQPLVGYMATPKVNFIIMSSSCCEPMAPDDAVAKLDYIKDGTPFDFDQNTTLVKDLKSKNERLTNAYIGLSKNKEHLVAFTIDANNQITQVEVSVSYKLYNQ